MDIGAQLRGLRPDRSRLVVRSYRGARMLAERLGVQFVIKSFYSPIPELRRLTPATFDRASPMRGIDMDLDCQSAFVAEDLSPHLAEFQPLERGAPAGVYQTDNPSYTRVDADVLHAMIRHLRPRKVLELGSGHSTLVAAAACQANARLGYPSELGSYDPCPAVAGEGIPGLTRLERVAAQQVPIERFRELAAGDVLFVDTTHTVKLGSDVNFVILDVLPELKPGVVVHFHDIFLPWEYPRHWIESLGLYWSEQYMLQAFLAMNPCYEVLCALGALARSRPQVLAEHVRGWRPGVTPGAFWIRRV